LTDNDNRATQFLKLDLVFLTFQGLIEGRGEKSYRGLRAPNLNGNVDIQCTLS
jgi:hypothetical protein